MAKQTKAGAGAKEAPAKPSEPTERMVLAGFEVDINTAAKALVTSGFGQTPETVPTSKEATDKLVKAAEAALQESATDGKLIAWLPLGMAQNSDRKKAIVSKVGDERHLGFYRAPSVSSWRGGIGKRPPARIEPDVVALD